VKNYANVKAWRKRNKDKVNEQAQRRRAKHPETFKEIKRRFRINGGAALRAQDAREHREWRRNNPEAERLRRAKFKAKLEAKRVEQAGRPKPSVCDICHQSSDLRIVFDHCHATGKFRGWICDRCNKVLGLVYDDVKLLKAMAKYLERTNGRTISKAAAKSPQIELRLTR
jgi:hypothetical protein